ncbi:MAG: exodeoxyribonuclease VII large subunit [Rhodobacteraceae bacterium]|nr:MAG: exodeoxyribonuclease VII large subunit [Paracoccaceae bacterium]
MDLIDEPTSNTPEFSVSEISGAVKRVIEGEFGRVRVRGEVGRVVVARTGHMYFDLKDDRAVIAGVSWKGQVARMTVRPEEGMEVIATGRLTTFAPQSKYQLQVESIEPAGAGALMAMLEKRKAALAAEGLFAPERKRALPNLPRVIGVITSPQGAVIRDILHRLQDRFGTYVLIWPVAVQGQSCAPEVARAIAGLNALEKAGVIPRPDLLIVARGGGSIEDLWGFNEEIVVRAAASSAIPLISAVGHETDTTLIDHAADRRAPTPTAAAEMAVPVHSDLSAHLATLEARLLRAGAQAVQTRRQRLSDLSRALPRPEALIAPALQRFDQWGERFPGSLRALLLAKRQELRSTAAGLRPTTLRMQIDKARERLADRAARATRASDTRLTRLQSDLAALDRLHQSLGYPATLRRGYAVVRDGKGTVLTSAASAGRASELEIEFSDARITVLPAKPSRSKRSTLPDSPPDQGSLF